MTLYLATRSMVYPFSNHLSAPHVIWYEQRQLRECYDKSRTCGHAKEIDVDPPEYRIHGNFFDHPGDHEHIHCYRRGDQRHFHIDDDKAPEKNRIPSLMLLMTGKTRGMVMSVIAAASIRQPSTLYMRRMTIRMPEA